MHNARRSHVATLVITGVTVLASLVPASLPRVASAQPVERPVATTASTPVAPGEDEALYSCKKRTGQVAVTFKPEKRRGK